LYTKQHGVESNLFLAPGEGDKVGEGAAPAEPSALAEREEAIPNAVRLLRGRDG
jgi:phosphoenolpyruvate carboxylase